MIRSLCLWCAVFVITSQMATGQEAATSTNTDAQPEEHADIKSFFQQYLSTFNEQKVEDLAKMWTEDGSHLDRETGERTEGRAAIKAAIVEALKSRPNLRLTGVVNHVKPITSDVVRFEGEITVSVPDEEPSISSFSGVLSRNGDKQWQIEVIEEADLAVPETSRDALSVLEWLIGSWEDSAGRVSASFRWSPNEAFMIRSYTVQGDEGEEGFQGTQIIAWDPRGQQIRSWSFNSDGSFGDAIWSPSGDEWLIKSTQTLADGRAASGTYVVKALDDDQVQLRLVAHQVEGEPVPAGDPAIMVRVVPEEEQQ